jgi:hypothetical protein
VYAWIWHHLPFGRPGKIVGSVLLALVAGLVLWYGVFPAAEHLLPFSDVQVTDDNGNPPGNGGEPGQDPNLPPPGVVPYSTVENNPSPRSSR